MYSAYRYSTCTQIDIPSKCVFTGALKQIDNGEFKTRSFALYDITKSLYFKKFSTSQ